MISFLLLVLVFFVPGYSILLTDRRLEDVERLALAPVISVPTISILYFVLSFFGVLNFYTFLIPLVFLCLFFSMKYPDRPRIPALLAAIFLVSFAVRLFLSPIHPYMLLGDEYAHFLQAQSLSSGKGFTTPILEHLWRGISFPVETSYRPPLYSFLLSISFLLSGVGIFPAQLVSVFFGAFLPLPAFLIARRLFNTRAALITLLMVAFNPFLLNRSVAIVPRVVVSFFILSFIYYVLKGKKFWPYIALSASLAYLTHYTALWFILAMAIYLLLKEGRKLFVAREWWFSILLFSVILSPWLVRNLIIFGSPFHSDARFAPFLVVWEDFYGLQPPTLSTYLAKVGIGWAVITRIINILTSYFPPPPGFGSSPHGLIFMFRYNLSGMISPPVFLIGVFVLLKEIWKKRWNALREPLILVVLIPSICAPAFIGWREANGVAVSSLVPLIPVYTILASSLIAKSKHWRAVMIAIFILFFFQTALVFSVEMEEEKSFPVIAHTLEKLASTPRHSILMSRDAALVAFYSGRNTVVTPFTTPERISEVMESLNVSYFVVSPADIQLRGLRPEKLMKEYNLSYSGGGFYVFNVSGRSG